ncbi:MAG: hemerythrin domain-containing protein [Dermatophilaceae bacterium]
MLTQQHDWIKTLMERVAVSEGPARREAFSELGRFLAAHEVAEEECLHLPGKKGLRDHTAVVDDRIDEEDGTREAIAELERLGTDSPHFPDVFAKFRAAVIAHAKAEEDEELPTFDSAFEDAEMIEVLHALFQVPELASQNTQNGASFEDHVQAARAELGSDAPDADD